MTRQALSAEQIAETLQKTGPKSIKDVKIKTWTEGQKKTPVASIWLRTTGESLIATIRAVIDIDYPHLSVISGVDTGDVVELLYHMQVFHGMPGAEVNITISVPVPKKNLVIPTISHLIPGAVYTEREKQEMLGVTVAGIPDPRGLFLPADFPKGVFPWRKDETGIPEGMVKSLYASGRPEDRPLPFVKPKEKMVKKSEVCAVDAVAPSEPDTADASQPEVTTHVE
ncbi:MAG: NADH-quinone oxidoreductase subunit C [Methanomicrobiales archaeon]|nr:NADH-quinone oxidoreductase subunit C [Methanomicrobiales archaeon]